MEIPRAVRAAESSKVERVAQELAAVARETARLLLSPRYDEAARAELDVRARELRAQLRAAASEEDRGDEPALELRTAGDTRSPLVSGG